MNISALSRTGVAVALSAILASFFTPAQADTTGSPLFPSLSLTPGIRDRMFMRFGYIHANIQTKSGDARDVGLPVVRYGDIVNYAANDPSLSNARRNQFITAGNALDDAMESLGLNGLGAPPGVKARADDSAGTPAISLGYYFTDDLSWVVEAYLLAVPLKSDVYGDGVNVSGNPNGLNGHHIISTKILPPTAMLGYYFGSKQSRFRPYLGVAAMYAIFFDTEATQFLNAYQGGASPGDTSVSVKNKFGFGPAAGFKYSFGEDWHVSMNVAQVNLKTEATLTTRHTTITSASPVTRDYDPLIVGAIDVGDTTAIMKSLAKMRDGRANGDLGTYVRKQSTTLNNTLFMLSIGRSF